MSDSPFRPEEDRSTLHDGVGAYALNSLSPVDRYAFEAHLAECAECRREYARYEAVATFLPEILARIEDGRTRRPSDVAEETSASMGESKPVQTTESEPETAEILGADFEPEASFVEAGTESVAFVEKDPDELTAGATPAELSVDADVDEVAPDLDAKTVAAEELVADVDSSIPDDAFDVSGERDPMDADASVPAKPVTEIGDIPAEISPEPETLLAPVEGAEESGSESEADMSEIPAVRRKRPLGRVTAGVQPDEAKIPTPSKWWWIATAIVGAIGLGSFVWALVTMEQKGDLETEISSLTAQVADFEAAQEQYAEQTPAIVLEVVPTTLGSPDATGSIFADPAGTSAVLTVAGMPPLGSDSSYQIWYLPTVGAESIAGPTFTPDASGNSVVQLDPAVASYAAVGITIEPAGGSTTPSANPVMQTA